MCSLLKLSQLLESLRNTHSMSRAIDLIVKVDYHALIVKSDFQALKVNSDYHALIVKCDHNALIVKWDSKQTTMSNSEVWLSRFDS